MNSLSAKVISGQKSNKNALPLSVAGAEQKKPPINKPLNNQTNVFCVPTQESNLEKRLQRCSKNDWVSLSSSPPPLRFRGARSPIHSTIETPAVMENWGGKIYSFYRRAARHCSCFASEMQHWGLRKKTTKGVCRWEKDRGFGRSARHTLFSGAKHALVPLSSLHTIRRISSTPGSVSARHVNAPEENRAVQDCNVAGKNSEKIMLLRVRRIYFFQTLH